VKVVGGGGGGKAPLDLRAGRPRGERKRERRCERRESYLWHGPRAPRAEFANCPQRHDIGDCSDIGTSKPAKSPAIAWAGQCKRRWGRDASPRGHAPL